MAIRYRAGDVITTEKPLVHALSLKRKGQYCDRCFGQGNLIKCSDCGDMFYCSVGCQQEDASDLHKPQECQLLFKAKQKEIQLFELDRILIRLVLKYKLKGDTSVNMFDGSVRSLGDLMDHRENLKVDQKRMMYLAFTYKVINQLQADLIEWDELVSLYGKIVINGFLILDIGLETIGIGLYIGTSKFNHSCVPNAAPVFDGVNKEIRAINSIKEGQEITVTYTDLKQYCGERRAHLKSHYYFDCDCARCRHELMIEPSQDLEFLSEAEFKVFKKLEEDYYELVKIGPDDIDIDSLAQLYWLGYKSLEYYQRIFGFAQCDPLTTIRLFNLIRIRSVLEQNGNFDDNQLCPTDDQTHPKLGDMINQLRKAITLTHGTEHRLFKHFSQLCQEIQ